jgi:hypothetical protein
MALALQIPPGRLFFGPAGRVVRQRACASAQVLELGHRLFVNESAQDGADDGDTVALTEIRAGLRGANAREPGCAGSRDRRECAAGGHCDYAGILVSEMENPRSHMRNRHVGHPEEKRNPRPTVAIILRVEGAAPERDKTQRLRSFAAFAHAQSARRTTATQDDACSYLWWLNAVRVIWRNQMASEVDPYKSPKRKSRGDCRGGTHFSTRLSIPQRYFMSIETL